MKRQIRYDQNKHQREFHNDISTKLLHISGGMGCVAGDTKIRTKEGIKVFSELSPGSQILSYDKAGFLISQCSGAYPKGKANLFRVVHTHGEFVAAGHHLVLDSSCRYQRVENLVVGKSIYSLSENLNDLLWTILESSQPKFQRDAPHLIEKVLGYVDYYAKLIRRYDLQLHAALDNVLRFFPSLNGAPRFGHDLFSEGLAHMDAHMELAQEHNHFCQLNARHSMQYSLDRNPGLALALGRMDISSIPSARTSDCIRESLLSLVTFLCRLKDQLFFDVSRLYPSLPAYSKILRVSKEKEDWYWDIQVPGPNNYVCAGAIHHNSGKSHGLVMKAMQLHMMNPRVDGGLLCPTYGDFRKDVLPLFEEICATNRIDFRYHQGGHYFTFPWSKKKLWVASGETKLRGPNWGYALINELTLIPFIRYQEVMSRVRDVRSNFPQIASVGTPEGTHSDYYNFFVENPPKNVPIRIIYADTRDNAHNLDPSYIPMLEASFDKSMIDAYLRGEWVNMNGNRFYYSYDPKLNEDRSLKFDPMQTTHAFMDFNVQHMTTTLWHFDGEKLYGFDEIVIENNAETEAMTLAMKKRGYIPDRTICYPDPAGKARKTTGQPDHVVIQRAGFQIRVKSQAPLMRQRQLNTNNLLDKGLVVFNPDAMPTFRRDMQAVEQDPVTLEKRKDNPRLTHASDGFDCGCDILFPFSGKKSETKIIKFR